MAKNQSSKNNNSRYAVIGLWISAISLVALLIAAAIKAFEATGFYTPTDLTLLPRLIWGSVAGVLIGLGIFALLDPNRIRRFLSGRQAKYGSNALITSVAFIAIIIFANVLAYQNPVPLDWTADKVNTLAPESIDALGRLPEPVKATAFFSSQYNSTAARDLLEKYRTNSKGKFDFEFVDPDRNPLAAQEAGITGDGKILLQMGQNRQIVSVASENEITNGFVKLLNPESYSIYFLSGEGERSIDDPSDTSFTKISQALENKNYTVKTLNLEAETIPNDAKVIVLAGPLTPLSTQAVDALKSYLSSGGSLIALEDPLPFTEFGDKTDLLAEYLSSDWGITLNDDIIIDTQAPSSAYFATAVQYTPHPITDKMGGIGVTFPYARSLSISTDIQDVTVTDLYYTTDQAWGETDFASIQANQPQYDPDNEQVGPMLLAATAENSVTGGRVMVVGNSSFAVDSNFDYSGNGDLLINSIDWSAENEQLISLSSVGTATERTFVAPGSFQRMAMLAASVCLIPLAIILMGAASWYTRRRQG
ncbi:MAG TPA: GldG family protein [Anaerolineales bacterium]|nr:GldG family protein [Anaerolineales bacterium]